MPTYPIQQGILPVSCTALQPAAASSPGRQAPLHLTAVPASGRGRRSSPGPPSRDLQLVALVEDARSGDDHAWRRLTARFEPTMRRIARGFRLSDPQIDDVMQNTWLRLFTS